MQLNLIRYTLSLLLFLLVNNISAQVLSVNSGLAPYTHTLPDGQKIEVIKCYPQGLMRAYCVSFDDGTLDSDKYILETLKQRNLKATFFINSLHEKSAEAMNNPQYYKGFEVASHGAHHIGFGKMPLDKAKAEIEEDIKNIERQFKQPVLGFAYPYGDIPTDRTNLEKIMKEQGLIYARGVKASNRFLPPENFLRWEPDASLGKDMIHNWNKYLAQPADKTIRVLMQFAHSIDYERGSIPKDIWEKYLDMIKHNNEIWNPTMLQFAQYVNALYNIEYSDKGIINHASNPVWIKINGSPHKINPGKMIKWKKIKTI